MRPGWSPAAVGGLQQDRRLVRRMAALAGGGRDVDPGSGEDSDLLEGLYESEGLHEAQARARRMQPFLMYSPAPSPSSQPMLADCFARSHAHVCCHLNIIYFDT